MPSHLINYDVVSVIYQFVLESGLHRSFMMLMGKKLKVKGQKMQYKKLFYVPFSGVGSFFPPPPPSIIAQTKECLTLWIILIWSLSVSQGVRLHQNALSGLCELRRGTWIGASCPNYFLMVIIVHSKNEIIGFLGKLLCVIQQLLTCISPPFFALLVWERPSPNHMHYVPLFAWMILCLFSAVSSTFSFIISLHLQKIHQKKMRSPFYFGHSLSHTGKKWMSFGLGDDKRRKLTEERNRARTDQPLHKIPLGGKGSINVWKKFYDLWKKTWIFLAKNRKNSMFLGPRILLWMQQWKKKGRRRVWRACPAQISITKSCRIPPSFLPWLFLMMVIIIVITRVCVCVYYWTESVKSAVSQSVSAIKMQLDNYLPQFEQHTDSERWWTHRQN